MKRQEIVNKLIKEGFSKNTLVNFSDKQLDTFSKMFINETLNIPAEDKIAVDKAKREKQEFNTYKPGDMNEKWNTNAKINKTGENTNKSISTLKSELNSDKKKSKSYQAKGKAVPESIKKNEKQKEFAIRAKKNFKGDIDEKWDNDAKIHHTGQYEDKTIDELQSELDKLKNNPNKTEALKKKEKQLMFAIRAKKNWKGGVEESDIDESKPSAGLSKEKKSAIVKKAKKGGDIGKKGKGFKDVEKKAAKEYGSKEAGKKVAAAAMWKNIKEQNENDKNEIMEWVNEIANKKYTNVTLKKEIMEMVTTKVEENSKTKVKKGHNGIPEFMTYDEIASAPVKEPTTKPKTPTTKPGTRPTPKTPYQPGPGINPRPKAMGDKKI